MSDDAFNNSDPEHVDHHDHLNHLGHPEHVGALNTSVILNTSIISIILTTLAQTQLGERALLFSSLAALKESLQDQVREIMWGLLSINHCFLINITSPIPTRLRNDKALRNWTKEPSTCSTQHLSGICSCIHIQNGSKNGHFF